MVYTCSWNNQHCSLLEQPALFITETTSIVHYWNNQHCSLLEQPALFITGTTSTVHYWNNQHCSLLEQPALFITGTTSTVHVTCFRSEIYKHFNHSWTFKRAILSFKWWILNSNDTIWPIIWYVLHTLCHKYVHTFILIITNFLFAFIRFNSHTTSRLYISRSTHLLCRHFNVRVLVNSWSSLLNHRHCLTKMIVQTPIKFNKSVLKHLIYTLI